MRNISISIRMLKLLSILNIKNRANKLCTKNSMVKWEPITIWVRSG